MNDKNFAKHIEYIEDSNKRYLIECLSYYAAYYISNLYYYDKKLLNYNLKNIINSILISFNNINYDDCDIKKIKNILKNKYSLEIIKENPLVIEIVK